MVRRQETLRRDDAELRHLDFARLMGWMQVTVPTVFTVTKKARHLPGTQRYILRLYCAEPNAVHQLPDPRGCYPVTVTDKWAGTLARHLTAVAGLLSCVTGLSGTVLGKAAPDLIKNGSQDLERLHEFLDHLKGIAGKVSEITTAADLPDHAHIEADSRRIEELLKSVDPSRQWGGLSKTLTPGGLTLYLCEDHARAYAAPSRRPAGL